jgi:hypothetical protein
MTLVIRLCAALIGISALSACSQPNASGNAPAAAAAAGGGGAAATTIPIPANKDVASTVTLPAGTHAVQIESGAATFHCAHVAINTQDGGVSNNFTDADVPPKLNMTDRTLAGHTYVSVDVSCHGGAADSQLVLSPLS